MNKTFPIKGHCLSTNKIIVKYLQNNFKEYINSVHPKKAIGVAWNEGRWWYVINQSGTPKYDPLIIMTIITEISKMKNPSTITGTLSTSIGIMPGNSICTRATTTTPIYNPNNIWIDGVNIGTIITKSLVTEPLKLRIKCQNLKKNLKL